MMDISRALIKIKNIERFADDLPWDLAAKIMKTSIQKSFDLGGRYKEDKSFEGGDRKWKPRKTGGSHPILQKSSRMKEDITYNASENQLEIVSDKDYSAAQHYGYEKRNLDSRPFITVQDEDLKEIGEEFAEDIAKRTNAS